MSIINFSKQELKQLSSISYDNLFKIIEEKTEHQYTIVQKKMIIDINDRLFSNMLHITKINDSAINSWQLIIKENREVLNRWNLKNYK